MEKLKQNIAISLLISLLIGGALGFLVSDYYLDDKEELIKELIASNNDLENALIATHNNTIEAFNITNSALYSINNSLNSQSNDTFNNELIKVLEEIARHTCLDAKYDAVSGAYFNDSSYSFSRGGYLKQDTRTINRETC